MSIGDFPAWDGIRPLDWCLLIDEAEAIRDDICLASVWDHINQRDFFAPARQQLDRVLAVLSITPTKRKTTQ